MHYTTFLYVKLLKECELFTAPRKIHKFSIIFPYSPHFFSGKTLDRNETTKPSGQKPAPSGTVQDIGYAKAKSIALNHAGLSENQAYDMDIELDDEDGTLVYEVEFKSGGMEYSYEINAASGAILKHETELED